MDHVHHSESHVEWSLETAARHLDQAIHDFRNVNSVSLSCISLTGPIALWCPALHYMRTLGHLGQHEDQIRDPGHEVKRILSQLTFPRFFIPFRFDVQDPALTGDEELSLCDRAGNRIADLDVSFSTHEVPSREIKGVPIKVADGNWIALDLVLNCIESTARLKPAQDNEKQLENLAFTEEAVAILALLLYSLDRLAQWELSLGLFAFDRRDQADYDLIRRHPHFVRYATAAQWFSTLKKLSQASHLASRYYHRRLRIDGHGDGEIEQMALRIKRSLLAWQQSLRLLLPEIFHTITPRYHALPRKWHLLEQIMDDSRFGHSHVKLPGYGETEGTLGLVISTGRPWQVSSDPTRVPTRVLMSRTPPPTSPNPFTMSPGPPSPSWTTISDH